jgi:hypothetical protein
MYFSPVEIPRVQARNEEEQKPSSSFSLLSPVNARDIPPSLLSRLSNSFCFLLSLLVRVARWPSRSCLLSIAVLQAFP